MNRFIAEAGEGGKAQTEIMGKLGLTMADLADKTPTEQLKLLAERVAGLQSPADRTNVAMQLFGRSGAELVPLFRAMGVELENARNQLGSAPAVADKAAQMFNTLGNNIKAVREKSAEFAFGLLSELLPNLVAVTTRLANIDAAGVGAKLSEYAKKTLDWATETFKLGDALKNAELAFKAITSGDIGGGLKLMFLQARDTALNAVNEIFANAKAAVQAFSGIMAKLFDTSGALFFTASTLIEMLSAKITSAFAGAVAGIVRAMGPAFENIADGIEYQAETAERTFGMLAKGIGAQFELVGDQLKEVIAEAPQEFRKNYESNIKDPLIEMESRMAETASYAAKVQENLDGAAKAMMQISDAAPTLGGNSPTVPSVADIANTVADAFGGGSTPASGSGGGSSPSGSPAPRQLTNKERSLMSPHEKRAADLESKGMFDSAERAREQGRRKVERQRERDANLQLQKDLGLQSSARMRPEDIARKEGKVSPLDRDAFKERIKEIEQEIKDRAGQGDGTENVSGGGGPKKGEPTQSPLEKLVSEIKDLVKKIEPKLPTAALA
jgi:hypothetical protein